MPPLRTLDRTHWEEVVGSVVDAIGIERFAEVVAYVVERKGYERLGVACELLQRMASMQAAEVEYPENVD